MAFRCRARAAVAAAELVLEGLLSSGARAVARRRVGLVARHLGRHVVVRVHVETVVSGGVGDGLGRGARLDSEKCTVPVRNDVVVGGGAGGVDGGIERAGKRRLREQVADEQPARDADALVVRLERVAAERDAGVVEADRDQRPDPDREDARLAVDLPVDCDEAVAEGRAEVVRVAEQE